jgi:hypothetical protein
VLEEPPTQALRQRDPAILRAGLIRLLVEGEEEWLKDWRDLLVAMAPYHDCARRLGLDPVDVFDGAAHAGPESLAETVQKFGRRRDITPRAFLYEVVEDEDGSRYESLIGELPPDLSRGSRKVTTSARAEP